VVGVTGVDGGGIYAIGMTLALSDVIDHSFVLLSSNLVHLLVPNRPAPIPRCFLNLVYPNIAAARTAMPNTLPMTAGINLALLLPDFCVVGTPTSGDRLDTVFLLTHRGWGH